MRPIAVVIAVFGVLAAIAAILYFALPAHSLPALLPGRVAHITGHRNRRGAGAAVVAVVLFVLAWVVAKHDASAPAA